MAVIERDIIETGGTGGIFGRRESRLRSALRGIAGGLSRRQRARVADLLEMRVCEDDGDDDAGIAAADTDDTTPDHVEHLGEMVKAIILDKSLSAEEKLSKIKRALKLLPDDQADDDDETDTEESDDADARTDGRGGDKGFGSRTGGRDEGGGRGASTSGNARESLEERMDAELSFLMDDGRNPYSQAPKISRTLRESREQRSGKYSHVPTSADDQLHWLFD